MMLLLAQAITETIPGGAGWVGAGLLGSVLAWLFFYHITHKETQIKEHTALFVNVVREEREICRMWYEENRKLLDRILANQEKPPE